MSHVEPVDDGLRWELRAGLHRLVVGMLRSLDEALDGPTDDAVVRRLFPPVTDVDGEGDEDDEDQLRAIIASDLLMRRHEAIGMVLDTLSRAEDDGGGWVGVLLRDDEPSLLLAVLNDVRLALGARVGATAVELRQLVDEEDERTHVMLEQMDLLAAIQMQLLELIDPVAARHDGSGEDPGGS